jgi:hypothetical protein
VGRRNSPIRPLELVHEGGHATGLGGAWDQHHEAFAAFVAKHARGDVLEVGGGGGKLARFFRRIEAEARWCILEPNPTLAEPIARASLMRGFFDANVSLPDGVETLVFRHCLEHIYDLAGIVAVMATKLPIGGRILIAWPNIERWILRGEPRALNWEHTFFVATDVLARLFQAHGFRLVERAAFGSDHSHFLALENTGAREQPMFSGKDASATGTHIRAYFDSFARKATALNAVAREEARPIYAAPASIYSQYLFAFGLEARRLAGLIDNSPLKQGRRLYGVALANNSSAALAERPSAVFLNGGAHNAEMATSFRRANPETEIVFVNAMG